jgi:hypothetical protein
VPGSHVDSSLVLPKLQSLPRLGPRTQMVLGTAAAAMVLAGTAQIAAAAPHAAKTHAHATRRVTFNATVTRVRGANLTLSIVHRRHPLVVRVKHASRFHASEAVRVVKTGSSHYSVSAISSSQSGAPSGNPGSTSTGSSSAGSGSSTGAPSSGGPGTSGVSTPGPGVDVADATAIGAVVQINSSSIELQLADGTMFTGSLPADAISFIESDVDVNQCETLSVQYHLVNGTPVIDRFTPAGVSVSPAVTLPAGETCASLSDGSVDLVGSLTAVSGGFFSISVPGIGQLTFPLESHNPLTAGYAVGSVLDINFGPVPGIANNLQYVELYTSGIVESVNGDAMTIKDAITGTSETFIPEAGSFDNVAVGDNVGLVYWQNGQELNADNVSDLTTGQSN